MDLKKIGQFIAQERKNKNLTQKELAQALYLSEKTISKWECGKGFLEVASILALCNILKITPNELLSGQKLHGQDIERHTEHNLLYLLHSKSDYTLKKWSIVVIFILSFSLLMFVIISIAFLSMPIWFSILLILFAIILFIASVILLCALSNSMGNFQCKHCGHKFTPTLSAFVWGAHTLKKRYLKCPCCLKKSFCTYISYKEQN